MSAGVLNQVSFKKESTWGTAVVPDKSIRVSFAGGIQTDEDVQLIDGPMARLSKNNDAFVGAAKHEGDFEMPIYPDYPAYLIASALGGVSSALHAGESIVYDHTITESEAKPSLTIEQVVGESVYRYAGCIVSGLKISAKTGEAAKLVASVKAKSYATATKISAAYTNNRPFNFVDIAFKIGGTTVKEVTNFELEYKNNVEFLHALNQGNNPEYNYVKGSEVHGKIEMYLDSTTLAELTAYLAKTEKAFQVVMTGAAVGVGANNALDITIPRAVYTTGETKISDDYNLLSVEFEGLYDVTTSKLISIVATNLLANLN